MDFGGYRAPVGGPTAGLEVEDAGRPQDLNPCVHRTPQFEWHPLVPAELRELDGTEAVHGRRSRIEVQQVAFDRVHEDGVGETVEHGRLDVEFLGAQQEEFGRSEVAARVDAGGELIGRALMAVCHPPIPSIERSFRPDATRECPFECVSTLIRVNVSFRCNVIRNAPGRHRFAILGRRTVVARPHVQGPW